MMVRRVRRMRGSQISASLLLLGLGLATAFLPLPLTLPRSATTTSPPSSKAPLWPLSGTATPTSEIEIRSKARSKASSPTDSNPMAGARNLHVVLRVPDAAKAAQFYESVLGMVQVRSKVVEGYTAITMAYGTEEFGQHPALQFVEDKSQPDNVKLGDGYMGANFYVDDIVATVEKAKALGGKVEQDIKELDYPACMIPDEPSEKVNLEKKAVVVDPSGYRVVLIEKATKDKTDKLAYVSLRVFDQQKAEEFYEKMGMKVIRKRANLPWETALSAWVGYDDDFVWCKADDHIFHTPPFTLELRYEYDSKAVKHGDDFVQLAVAVDKVQDSLAYLSRSGGVKVVKQAGPVGDDAVVGVVQDADGYRVALVEMESFNKAVAATANA